ncbi:MAG: hypothetical protein QOG72_810 [Sphingomonadales bacterium]|jgi:hypothetical protein|nr:hypothetical protein [Sphingomonadales bacterium]
MTMSGDTANGLNAAIEQALEEVLGDPDETDIEVYGRLRTLIRNCVADNYDESDVRAVIQLAFPGEAADEGSGDD